MDALSGRLLALSPWVERGALVLAVVALAALALRAAGARGEAPEAAPPSRRAEAAWLAAILLLAFAWRTAGIGRPAEPRWYFPATAVVWAEHVLAQGDLLAQWRRLLGTTQVSWPHESAVVMPVHVLFQLLLGPSLDLAPIAGAVWGTAAVALAWAAGRELVSPRFGLLFAAFLAAAPLQMRWSRLGGLQVAAVAHVLLVLWLAHRAGRRRTAAGVFVATVATWASVYHYYAARIALPLGALALVAGLARAEAARGRVLRVVAAGAAAAALGVAVLGGGGLWPRYTGYVGNAGERGLADVARRVAGAVTAELPRAAERYFWRARAASVSTPAPPDSPAWRPGMNAGGLALVPIALLGALGLGVALRHPVRHAVWLALAVLGLLLPVLSATTARRLLAFDAAWAALAAFGTLALLHRGRLRAPRWTGAAVAGVLALGGWAFATLAVLDEHAVTAEALAPIAFGESGFGDGRTCTPCVARARAWQREIADGSAVVLFDADPYREDRTIPGGLELYGKIAALAAGRPDHFLDWYALATNFDREPPVSGPLHRATERDAVDALRVRLGSARPRRVLWHFARPTGWERALAARLRAAGGVARPYAGPRLVETPREEPGIEVVTPVADIEAALAVLAPFRAAAPADAGCVRATRSALVKVPDVVTLLAPRGRDATPPWAFATWVGVGDDTTHYQAVRALAVLPAAGGRERMQIVNESGKVTEIDEGTAPRPVAAVRSDVGLGCGALAAGGWWTVDPVDGNVLPPGGRRIAGRWVGVVALGPERLLLASAEQRLEVLDTRSRRVVAAFPARVGPSRRFWFRECTPVVAGDGWVATLDHLTSTLAVYAPDGRPLGLLALDRVLGTPQHMVSAVGAEGTRLAVALGAPRELATLQLDLSACAR